MTLILTVGNDRQMVQFSDRRLSSGGVAIDEHSNKSTILTCVNGRFSIGYTGLARVGTFAMQPWLIDALHACGPPEFTIYEMAQRLVARLDKLFSLDPRIRGLNPADKRLTVMLTGYVYNIPRGKAGCLLISNFQGIQEGRDLPLAADEFVLTGSMEKDDLPCPMSYVQRVGAWPAMSMDDVAVLRELALRDAPTDVLVDAGVGIVRKVAGRKAANGSVGREVLATVIPRDLTKEIETYLRHDKSRDSLIMADQIMAFPTESVAVRDFQIKVDDSSFPPKLGRNDRCHCGSGRKFKICHGG